MSGILYSDGVDDAGKHTIDEDAYIQFVDAMFIADEPFFEDAKLRTSQEIVDFIQAQAKGSSGAAYIQDADGKEVVMTTENAKLRIEKDKVKDFDGVSKRKITISLPGANPDTDHPQGLSYLDRYVEAIVEEATGGKGVVVNPQTSAKLLLGMMLLTRCM